MTAEPERIVLCSLRYLFEQFIVEQEGVEPSFRSVPRAVLRTVFTCCCPVGFAGGPPYCH
jgi:hypothetical protein